jgi:hypothetical protein
MQNERDRAFTPTNDIPDTAAPGRTYQDYGADRPSDPSGGPIDSSHGVASRAKEAVSEVRHQAAEKIQARAESQKYRAADSLGTVAQSLRTASAQLPNQDGVSRYMERAAAQVDNLASFLNNREVADLVDEVEEFARRQPAIFVGGAFALGMIGARFLKSSRHHLVEDRMRHGWSTEELTARLDDPARDAISRPGAPGYVPADERVDGGYRAPGAY